MINKHSSIKRKPALFTSGLLLLLVLPLAQAQDTGASLIEAARCYICHQSSEASLGPPWQAIAVRLAPRREVMVEVLASKIVRGGGGKWGLVPMVPNQDTSEEKARVMAEWILDQAPE
jgi:cytochrome c